MGYIPAPGDTVEFGQYDKDNKFHLLMRGVLAANGGFAMPEGIKPNTEYEIRFWSKKYREVNATTLLTDGAGRPCANSERGNRGNRR